MAPEWWDARECADASASLPPASRSLSTSVARFCCPTSRAALGSFFGRSSDGRWRGITIVRRLSALRKTCRNYHHGESVPCTGEEFCSACFSIHQPGDNSVRPVLLEPGMSILPRELPAFRRGPISSHIEL